MDDIIFKFTRSDAINDGVLVDVTNTAKEAGLRFPVALTRAVWCLYVEVPPGVECQDEPGRLWDIVWMLRCAIHSAARNGCEILFRLHVRNDNRRPKFVTLKAVCGAGDDLEPVITVMLPDED
ncbi:MAG: DUF6573 family protein [Pirellulales bacterium]